MIADAVAGLFSEESLYYTGQALILNRGLTAAPPWPPNNKQGPELEVEFIIRRQAQLNSRVIDPNRTLMHL
jgi:hypothetical protein